MSRAQQRTQQRWGPIALYLYLVLPTHWDLDLLEAYVLLPVESQSLHHFALCRDVLHEAKSRMRCKGPAVGKVVGGGAAELQSQSCLETESWLIRVARAVADYADHILPCADDPTLTMAGYKTSITVMLPKKDRSKVRKLPSISAPKPVPHCRETGYHAISSVVSGHRRSTRYAGQRRCSHSLHPLYLVAL